MSKKNKINIPKDKMEKCTAIIHGASASTAGVGAGLAQVPLADSAIITPIQIAMIIALGKIFDQDISKATAKAIIGGATAALAGRGLSQLLVGWLPFVGNAINTATAAGITEAIGWLAVKNFSENVDRDIISDNPMSEDETKDVLEDKAEEEKISQREELITRANEFISGDMNRKENKDVYMQLLNDVEKFLIDIPQGDQMYDVYNKLMDLK